MPQARFLDGDLYALPLDDGEVDLAVCALALAHLDDLRPPVAELARVVRPGGHVVVSDLHPGLPLGQALFVAADGSLAFVRQHPHLHSEYLEAFASAGLDLVRCIEPRLGSAEAEEQGLAARFIPEATQAAFVGLPGALIWVLARPERS